MEFLTLCEECGGLVIKLLFCAKRIEYFIRKSVTSITIWIRNLAKEKKNSNHCRRILFEDWGMVGKFLIFDIFGKVWDGSKLNQWNVLYMNLLTFSFQWINSNRDNFHVNYYLRRICIKKKSWYRIPLNTLEILFCCWRHVRCQISNEICLLPVHIIIFFSNVIFWPCNSWMFFPSENLPIKLNCKTLLN